MPNEPRPDWSVKIVLRPLVRGYFRHVARLRNLQLLFARQIRALSWHLNPLGYELSERLLISLLRKRITVKVRRDWVTAKEPPHFSYNNYGAFTLAFHPRSVGPYPYLRGFLAVLAIKEGDRVLDISCGDGFFSKRFFAIKASHVDAIDIEPSAISTALRYNADPRVSYFVRDAIGDTFPGSDYDVIVWDGGIAHFPPGTNASVFSKVKNALKHNGIFCGSETLGFDGSADHLQRWNDLDEVRQMLAPHFKYVRVCATEYFYNFERTDRRGEFYWRCSDSKSALDQFDWSDTTGVD